MDIIVLPKTGRPTKYDTDIQLMADEYIFKYEQQGDVIPSHAGLCVYLGIGKTTLYNWEKEHDAFRDTLASIKVLQEQKLLNGGLSSVFNSTICKLALANHGYSDKIETDHKSSDGSMTPVNQADAVLEALKRKHADT